MAKKKDLIEGVSSMFSGGMIPDEPQQETTPQETEIKPRTYLSGRPRRDSTRPLSKDDDERTSLILNREQYAKVRMIAIAERMTIKDMVYEMFKVAIEKYEKKHGPIEVGKGQHRELF